MKLSEPLQQWVQAIAALPRPLVLAFDVDGTLAPIVRDAAEARVPVTLQRGLRRLARVPGVHPAVITGRDWPSLRRMLPLTGMYRAVEHGGLLLPPGSNTRPAAPTAAEQAKLQAFEEWALTHAVPAGADLERKRSSRGLHVRKLAASSPEQAEALLAQAQQAAARCGLLPRHGRSIVEAELQEANKGEALRRIVAAIGARGVFFAGDDLTDLPAIEQAVAHDGVGLFVRSADRPQAPEGVSGAVEGPEEIAAIVLGLVECLGAARRRPLASYARAGYARQPSARARCIG